MCLVRAAQPSKDCVQKTLKRLEERMQGRVLAQILYNMHCADRYMQHRTATALARLARDQDLKLVFVDRRCLRQKPPWHSAWCSFCMHA